jgi:hypothetical protein
MKDLKKLIQIIFNSKFQFYKPKKKYFKYLDEIFKQISLAEKKKNINNFLETPVCETGLRRFN